MTERKRRGAQRSNTKVIIVVFGCNSTLSITPSRVAR